MNADLNAELQISTDQTADAKKYRWCQTRKNYPTII